MVKKKREKCMLDINQNELKPKLLKVKTVWPARHHKVALELAYDSWTTEGRKYVGSIEASTLYNRRIAARYKAAQAYWVKTANVWYDEGWIDEIERNNMCRCRPPGIEFETDSQDSLLQIRRCGSSLCPHCWYGKLFRRFKPIKNWFVGDRPFDTVTIEYLLDRNVLPSGKGAIQQVMAHPGSKVKRLVKPYLADDSFIITNLGTRVKEKQNGDKELFYTQQLHFVTTKLSKNVDSIFGNVGLIFEQGTTITRNVDIKTAFEVMKYNRKWVAENEFAIANGANIWLKSCRADICTTR